MKKYLVAYITNIVIGILGIPTTFYGLFISSGFMFSVPSTEQKQQGYIIIIISVFIFLLTNSVVYYKLYKKNTNIIKYLIWMVLGVASAYLILVLFFILSIG